MIPRPEIEGETRTQTMDMMLELARSHPDGPRALRDNGALHLLDFFVSRVAVEGSPAAAGSRLDEAKAEADSTNDRDTGRTEYLELDPADPAGPEVSVNDVARQAERITSMLLSFVPAERAHTAISPDPPRPVAWEVELDRSAPQSSADRTGAGMEEKSGFAPTQQTYGPAEPASTASHPGPGTQSLQPQ